MTQEEKDLLLKDLCARLPYGVKIAVNDGSEYWTLKGMFETKHTGITLILEPRFPSKNVYPNTSNFPLSICKPYLRPMSSMTEEEKEEYKRTFEPVYDVDEYGKFFKYDYGEQTIDTFDWLLANHFDFRGLIEKDAAIAVTKNNNPYKD